MGSHTTCAFYDLLPTEITWLVFHYLLPHQLTGLASSCHQAREVTGHYPSERTSSLEESVTLRWANRFRKLHSSLQSAIEEIVGVLPLMDVSAFGNNDTETLYLSVALAHHKTESGLGKLAITSIDDAEQAAFKTGLSLDLSALRRQCWEAELKFTISRVKCYTSEGNHHFALLVIKEANEAAMNARLPLPDFSGVMRECWEKRLRLEIEEVNAFAQLGFDELALSHIEKANKAAMKSELPLPDFSKAMRECWEKKLDFAIKRVRRLPRTGLDEYTVLAIERCEEAAMKAELPLPDFIRVMRECWEKKLELPMEK